MTTPQWAPADALDLDPNSSSFTCVGYAPSKGRRCHNAIACVNRQEAAKILLQMSRLDPQSQRIDDKLEELASRLLCRRWHQNQAAEMKRKWHCDIETYLAAESARREEEDLAGRENDESNEDEAEEEGVSEEHVVEAATRERPHEESRHTLERRAVEGDCSICCEELSTGGDTVWCRAQCRQNLHADCLGLWHASQEADGRRKTCPYW